MDKAEKIGFNIGIVIVILGILAIVGTLMFKGSGSSGKSAKNESQTVSSNYVGTWERFSIRDSSGNKVSSNQIASNTAVPSTCVIKSDGSGYFKVNGGRKDSFSWSQSNGKIQIHMSGNMKAFENRQGYIVYEQAAMTSKGLKYISAFFSR